MTANQTLYEGGFVRIRKRGRWEFAERVNARGAVVIVVRTEADHVLLVEQYRAPVDAPVIEFPAGLVGDIAGEEDEALERAASRELEEETGYRAGTFELLTSGPPSAGMDSEITWWMRARDIARVGDGGGDDSEAITVHAIPLAEINAWLEQQREAGILVDPKVYAGLYFLMQEDNA
ncbi:NUDIX hydrolase [Salinisphaera sp. USBA-960]|nr:NUDIX hydrolase [Salifodinibacter halophilus]NNC26278.1 NUDIX hydrolase [Salifodinibacter halophilus]